MGKEKAIYDPGELAKVRSKLGVKDDAEAARLQKLFDGEVGKEKTEAETQAAADKKNNTKQIDGEKKKPKHLVELAEDSESASTALHNDIVTVNISKPSYFERVKMDVFSSYTDFGLKSGLQVLGARLSFFNRPPDKVKPSFVTTRLNDYYKKLEELVKSTRLIFPRNNTSRSNALKKASPFAFNVLNTLRQWDVETILSELSRVQSHPRFVIVSDLAIIIKLVYKPLYILEFLDVDTHIHESFKVLYRLLDDENHRDSAKNEKYIQSATINFAYIKKNIRYYLYPVLLKLLSDQWLPYESFFTEKQNEYLSFLGVKPDDRIKPEGSAKSTETNAVLMQEKKEMAELFSAIDAEAGIENSDAENIFEDIAAQETEPETDKQEEKNTAQEETTVQTKKEETQNEMKAVERGLKSLEMLFPKAGWNALDDFPDLFPYFKVPLDLFNGSEYIAPEDPAQQALILSLIIQDLLYGFRSIDFSESEDTGSVIIKTINDWNSIVAYCFNTLYLPSVSEYVQAVRDGGGRATPYTSKLQNNIHWMRRQFIFPYYQFQSITAPTYTKKDITSLFTVVKHFKRALTNLIANIDTANKFGGAEAGAAVEGINNPWEDIKFELPNAVSKRLKILLGKGKSTNVNLIVFTYAITSVLDNLLNNENSHAYTCGNEKLFRSSDAEGRIPVLWVDEAKIDANKIFKDSIAKIKGQ